MSLYDHVGLVAPGLSVDLRAALVATARSRGTRSSVDEELREIRRQLNHLDASVPSLADARRRVAEAEADIDAKRERVATLRGKLQATDDEAVAESYRAAIRNLSEAETERDAAREALSAARDRAREARDEREQRLRLEDRASNLRRGAREELRREIRPRVDSVVPEVPAAEASTVRTAGQVTAALALIRVGRIHLPVVLACRRFESTAMAEDWLGSPVYRL